MAPVLVLPMPRVASFNQFSNIPEKMLEVKAIHGITLISEDKDVPYWNPQLLHNPLLKVCQGYDSTGDLYKLPNVYRLLNNVGKVMFVGYRRWRI